MTITIQHDGYVAAVEYDEDTGIFHGEIVNMRDVVTFQTTTAEELQAEFETSIRVYVEHCRETGKKPCLPQVVGRLCSIQSWAKAVAWRLLLQLVCTAVPTTNPTMNNPVLFLRNASRRRRTPTWIRAASPRAAFPVMAMAFVLTSAVPVVLQPAVLPGSDLAPGMQLVYSSAGQDQTPWVVDSAQLRLTLRAGSNCARTLVRRAADQPPSDVRTCVSGDTLFTLDPQGASWIAQRPVGPNMTLVLPRPNRDTVRYTTAARSVKTLSGRQIAVLATTVLTVDSLGKPKRRLTEQYSLGLLTATEGHFEIPDSAAASGWRTQQQFHLREIRPPR